MENYAIKVVNKDFVFIDVDSNLVSNNNNRIGIDRKKKYVLFKSNDSVAVEKVASVIGEYLNLNMSHVELAIAGDEVGLLCYSFRIDNSNHYDMILYFNDYLNRNRYYTIEGIKEALDRLNPNLFGEFVKMTLFDALIGNSRKEDNWGYIDLNNKYSLSPLYSNKMLFKDESEIYKDNNSKYSYSELIGKLYKDYPEYVEKEIRYYKRLNKKIVQQVVDAIPDIIMSLPNKEQLILNILDRRNKLLDILKEDNVYV